jgi:hypothetical protein
LSLFFAHTWAFPPNRPRRTCAVDTRGLTGPMPCDSSIFLSSVCPFGLSRPPLDTLESPRSESQGMPRALRRVTSPFGHGLIVRLIRRLTTVERRGTSSVRCLTLFSRRPHQAPGMSSVDTRPPHRGKLVHADPTPALQMREDPGAHARPNRDASRSIIAWPLRRRPYGTTLATYPSRRRVRAVTSVRGRTRTGRIWFQGTAPFET